jgi:hypothetical protein
LSHEEELDDNQQAFNDGLKEQLYFADAVNDWTQDIDPTGEEYIAESSSEA